jgi:hypothetical protein
LKLPCVGDLNIDGMLFPGGTVTVGVHKVTDGTSKTLMIGERWYQLRAWTAGNYFGAGGMIKTGGGINAKESPPPSVPLTSMSSSAKNISFNIPPNPNLNATGYYNFHRNSTDRPPMPSGAAQTMGFNDLPFGSAHPGIVNFVRADGGTEVITDNIDMLVYVALGSRNGDEVVNQQQ